jgi:hypothetical protein
MKNSDSFMRTSLFKQASIGLVLLLVIIGYSCKTHETNSICIALTKMNVLFRGVDNPANIAVTGVVSKDMKVTIDNGTIKEVDGSYLLNPVKLGDAVVKVFVNDKLIGSQPFRVKDLPDPVAKVKGKRYGMVDKEWLVTTEGVTAEMENSEFDYSFAIVSFSVSLERNGKEVIKTSTSNKFTSEQIDFFKTLKPGEKLNIENIQIMGPEGAIRNLQSSIVFKIAK